MNRDERSSRQAFHAIRTACHAVVASRKEVRDVASRRRGVRRRRRNPVKESDDSIGAVIIANRPVPRCSLVENGETVDGNASENMEIDIVAETISVAFDDTLFSAESRGENAEKSVRDDFYLWSIRPAVFPELATCN